MKKIFKVLEDFINRNKDNKLLKIILKLIFGYVLFVLAVSISNTLGAFALCIIFLMMLNEYE